MDSIPCHALIVVLLVSNAAADDKKTAKVVTYNDDIKPILRQHCLKCHGNDEQNADLNLQSYGTLMKGGSAGVVVKPGRPGASILFQAITSQDDDARMPPESPPIPKAQIELIRKWIASGLRETSNSKSLAPSKTITFNPKANASSKPTGPPAMPTRLAKIAPSKTSRPLPVLSMAASPWAPLLAASGYQHIRLFDVAKQEPIGDLAFPEGIPQELKFSRNGDVLLAAGGKPVQSGSVVLFDVRTGKRLAQVGDELDSVLAADISPNQKLVAFGGSGRKVKAYSTTDGKLKFTLQRHTDWITSIAFSPDGRQLATADRAGGIHLWDAKSGGVLLSLSNHTGSVRSIDWRGDSKVLASSGDDGKLIWWNSENGFIVTEQSNPHPPPRPKGVFGRIPNGVLCASFGPKGHLLTCGRDQTARLWYPNGGHRRAIAIDRAIPTRSAISHDGKTLMIGDSVGRVHFHDFSK